MAGRGNSDRHNINFKCILLGPPNVGKTCLANRLATGKFVDSPITAFTTPCVMTTLPLSSGDTASMELWDTAGQERYRTLTASYFRHTQAVLLVYDQEHKTHIAEWIQEVQRHLHRNEALVFLLGTKLDLGSDVTLAEVEALRRVGKGEVEIEDSFVLSAKTGQNVLETFGRVAECVWRARQEKRVNVSRREDAIQLGHGRAKGPTSNRCCS